MDTLHTDDLEGEKSIPDQMQVLFEKWDPNSTSSVFQHYFYNQVGEERAPYYAPGPHEDEKKWEEALKNKPNSGSIPVLAVGPLQVGRRLEVQAVWARGLQTRLHELNEVLTKRLQAHDLQYSVRAQEARRKHIVLSRRCLALATKVQVLRNRGYALDGAEEQIRMKLTQLEKIAFDPMLSGRQEEIWAKMSVLRDRAQILKAESEKLAKEIQASSDNGIDEEQMKRVEKVRLYIDVFLYRQLMFILVAWNL
jgi:nuclear pore complex protein Nup54